MDASNISVKNPVKFDRFFKSQEHSDVEFVVKSRDGDTIKIPAHRFILMTQSDVLERMLYGELKEGPSVKIVDVCAEAFEEFLQLFYRAEVMLTPENIGEVIMLIDKYNTVEFWHVCEDFMLQSLTTSTAYCFYDLVTKFRMSDELKIKFEKFICRNSLEVLSICAENRSSLELWPKLLKYDQFLGTEIEIFDAVITCAKASLDKRNQPITVENIRAELGDCLYQIRFPIMTNEELLKCFRKHLNLLPAEVSLDILSFVATKNQMTYAKKFSIMKRCEFVLKFVTQEESENITTSAVTLRWNKNIEKTFLVTLI